MEEIIFPNQIRMYRRLKGVSMQALADHLGVSLSAVSKVEKGYRRVDQEQLVRIAEFLDCSMQDLFVNELNSSPEVVQAWRREQERRNQVNESTGLKTLGAGLRQIRTNKGLTLIEVAEASDMTLSVYHRIEMGQREVSEKERINMAKALSMDLKDLDKEISELNDKGYLKEIIQKNDSKYQILSSANGLDSSERTSEEISVFGVVAKEGDILVDFDGEVKKVARPCQLYGKNDAYAINLCTRRLGSLLPSRSILFVDTQEAVSVGDIAIYYKDEETVAVVSVRENEDGSLYGRRWNPDEKIQIDDNKLDLLHKVVAINL